MPIRRNAAIAAFLVLSACAETTVQPMAKDTFKIHTQADFSCGAAGTRNIAFRAAALEVIRRGGDRFIILGDDTGYDGWSGIYDQGMVVRMVSPNSPDAHRALSAREILGPDWREKVAKGIPNICTD